MSSLTTYLRKYYPIQEEILLVYRPDQSKGWSERCLYLDDDYSPHIRYNHRSILKNEIVIEFDEDDKETNRQLADRVSQRLSEEGFTWTKWYSGNRSTHIHTFMRVGNVRNLVLLKKCFLRYITLGLEQVPDMRLASNNHLIRAEFGIHEKTGEKKSFISTSGGKFPKLVEPPLVVWDMYVQEQRANMKRRISNDLKDIEAHPGFQYIVNSEQFRTSDDGRERALFMLIHVLKPKYKDKKQELIKFLQEWYRYSSGRKLNDRQIAGKVYYHWDKDYSFSERYINELLESIGRSDLCQKQKQ